MATQRWSKAGGLHRSYGDRFSAGNI